MKRKTHKPLNLTAERAAHALGVLIADGKIAAKDVANALKRRESLIRDLRRRLDALVGGKDGPFPVRKTRPRRAARKARRRLSAGRRAALKLHGKYLGHIRTLPKGAKARVKKIRGTAGVHAAIRAAKTMAASAARAQRAGVRRSRPGSHYQSSQQRKLTAYQQKERRQPDKHGGSGSGRQQGGSGAGRERG